MHAEEKCCFVLIVVVVRCGKCATFLDWRLSYEENRCMHAKRTEHFVAGKGEGIMFIRHWTTLAIGAPSLCKILLTKLVSKPRSELERAFAFGSTWMNLVNEFSVCLPRGR